MSIIKYELKPFKLVKSIQIELKPGKPDTQHYLPHYYSDKAFKGTLVNRTLSSLNEDLHEITLTVPLNLVYQAVTSLWLSPFPR